MIDRALARAVRDRAGNACEYCLMPQAARRLRFAIDHITAQQHHGPTASENLALCCGRCNRHKGPNLTGIDPQTKSITRLYNPRQDHWNDHFEWNGALIQGTTEIGRTTIDVLKMNHPEDVAVRRELIESGGFLPSE